MRFVGKNVISLGKDISIMHVPTPIPPPPPPNTPQPLAAAAADSVPRNCRSRSRAARLRRGSSTAAAAAAAACSSSFFAAAALSRDCTQSVPPRSPAPTERGEGWLGGVRLGCKALVEGEAVAVEAACSRGRQLHLLCVCTRL